ncbi:MAG: molybdopterin synthase catalytic subunit MoaE [Ectothiorhodospiraceae bacterium]|nr:molybdopterin synthase catalytic subunit MoaE [Ectothiorhodospiraceae bacterium]
MTTVRVQSEPFDAGAEMDRMRAANPAIGALATFVGVVRDVNDARSVSEMTLEHYPGMTERALAGIVAEARERWRLLDVTVVHRVGTLRPTDPIVLVITASGHRQDAFDSCAFVMDFLKTRAPFWKKERTPEGERWVEARASDDDAARRWQPPD